MPLQAAPAPAEPFSVPATRLIGVNAYFLSYSETANGGTAAFAGQMAHTSTRNLTVSDGNTVVVTQTDTDYYLENPYTPLGAASHSAANPYELVLNSISALPAVLQLGASGPLASGTYYVPGTHIAIGTLTETYTVAPYSSTLLKLSLSDTGMLNGTQLSQVMSYTLDASGNISLSSIELALPTGVSVLFGLPAP
jgi:hypothetical protein